MSVEEGYPEHVKLAKVAEKSQVCGEFLDWIRERYTLATFQAGYQPQNPQTSDLLAEFFQIDRGKVEVEKRLMMEALRVLHGRR